MGKLRVKQVLRKKGITQYKLAQILKVTPNEIGRLCQEDYNPTLRTLLRVAEALDVGLDELVERSKKKKHKK